MSNKNKTYVTLLNEYKVLRRQLSAESQERQKRILHQMREMQKRGEVSKEVCNLGGYL